MRANTAFGRTDVRERRSSATKRITRTAAAASNEAMKGNVDWRPAAATRLAAAVSTSNDQTGTWFTAPGAFGFCARVNT
ncbi:Uncharacterised protein [Mycobacteroides abscessus subsp. abscessus]|nr:Uncharacterised protein [Mycobacteroides abscessus subsp. abscessus]